MWRFCLSITWNGVDKLLRQQMYMSIGIYLWSVMEVVSYLCQQVMATVCKGGLYLWIL